MSVSLYLADLPHGVLPPQTGDRKETKRHGQLVPA
jgi:hypothetical protein